MASGDYLRPGQLIEVDTTGEDPEFTRHPNVLGHRKIVSPPETPINLDPIVSLKDPGSLDAASASQLEFEELNTKNPDVLIDAGSVTDGSEYRDNSPPDSDSDSDSEFEPEPEMTELDSTEEREEKDARIHAMAAKIHHRLAEEKERVGLNTEEEEMLRSLEESSDYVSESDGSHVTSIPQSPSDEAGTSESAEVDPSDLYPASPPISVQNQSDREYSDPGTAMPTSMLPTATDTGTSPPARGRSPSLTSRLSTQETAALLGDPSDRDSVSRRLEAIKELVSVADRGQTMSPTPFETDEEFVDRLDGIDREFPNPDLSSTSLSDLKDGDDVRSVRSLGQV